MNKYRIDYTIIGVTSATETIQAENFNMAYHNANLYINHMAHGEKWEIESISLVSSYEE